jgi:hypothetical protein
MCLTATKNCFRYAKKDIECYKVIIESTYHFITPYTKTIIPFRVINGLEPFTAKGRTFAITENGMKNISIGYIHTYETLGSALSECRTWGDEPVTIFRCTIPKGTRYAKGYCKKHEGYASKQIIFNEKIEYNKNLIL